MINPAQAAALRAPPPVVPVDMPLPVPQMPKPAAPPVTTLLVTETVPTSSDGAMAAMGVIGGE